MTTRSPEFTEVLDRARESAAADVRVACVARVVRWSSSKPREVDVQPVMKRAYTNEDGVRTAEKLPVIPSVPLIYPGGGGFVVTWPMQVGDEVLLVFSDDSLDSYLQVGGAQDIDPQDDRRHHLSDAIAIPGIAKLNAPINVSNNSMQLGTLGAACQGAALGDTLKTYLDNLTIALGTGSNSGGPVTWGTSLPAVPTVASATVKVSP